MTDKQLQAKLDALAKVCTELNKEAQRRYKNGGLFFESDGHFHIMAGDVDAPPHIRQEYIRFSSVFCTLGCGSW